MAGQPAANKKKTNVILVFAIAQFFIAALLWVAFSGSGDREGRIKVALAAGKAAEIQNAIASYHAANQILPADNKALTLPDKQGKPYFTAFEVQGDSSYAVSVAHGVITLTFAQNQQPVSGKTLVYIPRVSNGKLEWICTSGTVEAVYLPPQCQSQQQSVR